MIITYDTRTNLIKVFVAEMKKATILTKKSNLKNELFCIFIKKILLFDQIPIEIRIYFRELFFGGER